MKRILILVIFIHSLQLDAQTTALSHDDQVSMYECKTVEDFMFRFNNDSMSSLNQSMVYYNMGKKLTRPESFKLCFKMDSKHNVETQVYKDFANYVLQNNIKLQFEDSLWYARAFCTFDFQGKEIKIPLLLQLYRISEMRSKWMIVDVGNHPVLQNASKDTILKVKRSLKRGISANSYAMNFLDLKQILTSTTKESSAFSKEFLEQEKGIQFLNLIKTEQLSFEYAGSMTFYFAQIPGYFFVVDNFQEDSLNSGWLINYIWKKTEEEKKAYLKILMNAKK
jgi:hypothetical protein